MKKTAVVIESVQGARDVSRDPFASFGHRQVSHG
jgi:hypothetical protein